MTDDHVSRRKVLGAAAITGALGFSSGASVRGMLGDQSRFSDNAATGGTLDLLVEAAADVEPDTWSPSLSSLGSGAAVTMNEPCGTAGLAVAVCGNPGTVALSTADDAAAGDGTDATAEPFLTLFTGDCANGRVLTAGRLSTVRTDLADGVPLHPESRYLGKIEEDEITDGAEVTFDHNGETVTVAVDAVEEGGETIGVDLSVDGAGLSQVNVKGGGHPLPDPCSIPPWVAGPQGCSKQHPGRGPRGNGNGPSTGNEPSSDNSSSGGRDPAAKGKPKPAYGRRIGVRPYFFDCATEVTGLRTRDEGDTAVSHLELYVCEKRCYDCEVDPPFPVYVKWAGARAEHTLEFDLAAVQCRHVAAGGDG